MEVDGAGAAGRAAALVARDPGAWEHLYRTAHPQLLAYARRRTPDRQRAEDAVSETVTRAFRAVERYDARLASPEGWLVGILRNVLREDDRRAASPVNAAPADDRALDAAHDPGLGPDGELLKAEEAATLRRCFGRLRPDEQELLELRVVARLSSQDVGALLGMSAGAVRMAQARALARLRAQVEEVAGAAG